MSVYFSPILRILEDHGMLIPSQSPKFGAYAHMFVLPLSLHKYVYCRAASTHFIIWVFYISTVDSNWPRSSKYEKYFRHMTKLKPHAYAFFCLAEHERPYALDISTIFSKLSRADRCFLDLCWPSKLTRILSKLFSFSVFLTDWPHNFMFGPSFLFP